MRRETWDALEALLDRVSVRPIVGVVPDNRDEKLRCSPPDGGFWDCVRRWERKGWAIAMHGLHHRHHPIPHGARTLVPLHDKSEFVGLPAHVQRSLIRRSWSAFAAQGVRPALFMAPSHSFDGDTLAALRDETDIRIITDGLAVASYEAEGFVWLPQQLWRFRSMPFGLWTVCLHPNTMTAESIERFRGDLAAFRDRITAVADLELGRVRSRSVRDRAFSMAYQAALRVKRHGASA
jgi:predicted deacetylase